MSAAVLSNALLALELRWNYCDDYYYVNSTARSQRQQTLNDRDFHEWMTQHELFYCSTKQYTLATSLDRSLLHHLVLKAKNGMLAHIARQMTCWFSTYNRLSLLNICPQLRLLPLKSVLLSAKDKLFLCGERKRLKFAMPGVRLPSRKTKIMWKIPLVESLFKKRKFRVHSTFHTFYLSLARCTVLYLLFLQFSSVEMFCIMHRELSCSGLAAHLQFSRIIAAPTT